MIKQYINRDLIGSDGGALATSAGLSVEEFGRAMRNLKKTMWASRILMDVNETYKERQLIWKRMLGEEWHIDEKTKEHIRQGGWPDTVEGVDDYTTLEAKLNLKKL